MISGDIETKHREENSSAVTINKLKQANSQN